MAQTQPHYTLAELGRIRARTLIVAGEHDMILRKHTDSLARAIPGAKEIIAAGRWTPELTGRWKSPTRAIASSG